MVAIGALAENASNEFPAYLARDRYAFHHSYYNMGGTCLLACYASMLEWANSYPMHIWDKDNYDVFSEYLEFHNTLEPVAQISAKQIRNNSKTNEEKISKAINSYCINRSWSGYIQIENFHNWLKKNTTWADGIDIVARLNLENRNQPLKDSYNKLMSYFVNNIQPGQYDYVSLVIIGTTSGPHSILIGYGAQGHFLRDPNYTDKLYDSQKASFGFSYSCNATIYEALVFRVKRNTYVTDNKRVGKWTKLDKSILEYSDIADDNFYKLQKPIPVKKLRLDMSTKVGSDGTNAYTAIKLESKRIPSVHIRIGHYYPDACIMVNNDYCWIGTHIFGSIYEFDLTSFGDVFYITHYQPNFNFDLLQIAR